MRTRKTIIDAAANNPHALWVFLAHKEHYQALIASLAEKVAALEFVEEALGRGANVFLD